MQINHYIIRALNFNKARDNSKKRKKINLTFDKCRFINYLYKLSNQLIRYLTLTMKRTSFLVFYFLFFFKAGFALAESQCFVAGKLRINFFVIKFNLSIKLFYFDLTIIFSNTETSIKAVELSFYHSFCIIEN